MLGSSATSQRSSRACRRSSSSTSEPFDVATICQGSKQLAQRMVYLVRQKSAWNNAGLLTWIVGLLGAALRPYLGDFQPILLLDTVKFHWSKRVLAACRAAPKFGVEVPATARWPRATEASGTSG